MVLKILVIVHGFLLYCLDSSYYYFVHARGQESCGRGQRSFMGDAPLQQKAREFDKTLIDTLPVGQSKIT